MAAGFSSPAQILNEPTGVVLELLWRLALKKKKLVTLRCLSGVAFCAKESL
jgi:hypothetical protein